MHERIISLFAFNFHFNSKFDWSSTNSKTCLKPLAQSKILWNIDIVDTRHLRQNLLLEAKSFIKKHRKSYFYNYQQQSTLLYKVSRISCATPFLNKVPTAITRSVLPPDN